MKISLRREKREFLTNAPGTNTDTNGEKSDARVDTGIKTGHL